MTATGESASLSRFFESLDLFAEECHDAALGLENGGPGHSEASGDVVAGEPVVGRKSEGLPRLGLDPCPSAGTGEGNDL